jgi:cell wall-associated NlpC family hydrolase
LRPVRGKALGLGVVCGVALAGGAGWVALAREDATAGAGPRVEASIDGWRWAPRDELPKPKVVKKPSSSATARTTPAAEPEQSAPVDEPAPAADETIVDPVPEAVEDLPKSSASTEDVLSKAEVLKNGVALPPLEAPSEVRAIFEAGNTIARSPYKWGGGHGKWRDSGYDCSGSVSYALAAAGLLDAPLASGPLMSWGKPGKGKWITIYSNPGHVFMVVAGVRFDTVARGQTGSRWINAMTDTSGYVARHPQGF